MAQLCPNPGSLDLTKRNFPGAHDEESDTQLSECFGWLVRERTDSCWVPPAFSSISAHELRLFRLHVSDWFLGRKHPTARCAASALPGVPSPCGEYERFVLAVLKPYPAI